MRWTYSVGHLEAIRTLGYVWLRSRRVSYSDASSKKKTPFIYKSCHYYLLHWGHAVVQLVEALPYKPAGHGFIGIFH